MKKLFLVVILLIFANSSIAQLVPPGSAATTDDVFSIITNPAGLAVNHGLQLGYMDDFTGDSLASSSFYISDGTRDGSIGLSFHRRNYLGSNPFEYRFVSGSRIMQGLYFGYGIGFGKSLRPMYSFGMIFRPAPFVSIGATGINLTENNSNMRSYCAGLGLRPLGSRLTVSADAIFAGGDFQNAEFNVSSEIIDGLHLNAYYLNENQIFGVGLGINLHHHSVSAYRDVGDGGRFSEPVGLYHFSGSSKRSIFAPELKQKFVELTIDGPLLEERPRFRLFGAGTGGRTVTDLVLSINRYSNKDDIAGMVLNIKNPVGGPAKYQEIREALAKFQLSGKKIFAYLENAGNAEYYLASVADSIYLNPAGGLWLTGAATQLIFIKDLLSKVGISAHFVHTGEYKTAGNMFTEDSASSANLEQMNAYLDDYYRNFTSDIGLSRAISRDSVNAIVDSGPLTAGRAKSSGLVDLLIYQDELKERIQGKKSDASNRIIVSEKEYAQSTDWEYDWDPPVMKKIAIVYAVGPIIHGKSSQSPFSAQESMGSETIAKAIENARKDNQVKAIVLRVNSPGGSALASDIIWREIDRTVHGENRKPVIVSMSDVVASGGYYISMAADSILVNQGTLTGSIGVIAGTFNLSELFQNIGISITTIKRGENADFLNPAEELREEDREKLRELVYDTYDQFVHKVAEGRQLPVDTVQSIAEGRIYSGEDAIDVGLADAIGGIERAIITAKQAAKIPSDEEVNLVYLPEYSMKLSEIFGSPRITAEQLDLPREIIKVLEHVDKTKLLANEQVLFLLPYTFVMED